MKVAEQVRKVRELKNAYEVELLKLQSENLTSQSKSYLDSYVDNIKALITAEREYVVTCNELSFSQHRLAVLTSVLKLQNQERPLEDTCPACHQPLPSDVAHYYKHYQSLNDTNAEIDNQGKKIKGLQAKIISSRKRIEALNSKLEKEYSILNLT